VPVTLLQEEDHWTQTDDSSPVSSTFQVFPFWVGALNHQLSNGWRLSTMHAPLLFLFGVAVEPWIIVLSSRSLIFTELLMKPNGMVCAIGATSSVAQIVIAGSGVGIGLMVLTRPSSKNILSNRAQDGKERQPLRLLVVQTQISMCLMKT